jgi:peptidoglycan/xylan/chitin deacetylase (PgdA/CDA1 family)
VSVGRWLSFRFDDGFMQGAQKAAALLAPDAGSFFLITDFASGAVQPRGKELFEGRDFGSLEGWRRLSDASHDIQAHSASHPNFSELGTDAQISEARRALAFVRQVHNGPYVFCAPFNVLPTVDLAAVGYAAAGFVTPSSDGPIIFNRPEAELDLFRLRSWAVRERHFEAVVRQLAVVPDGAWVILAFHSLDGEGWETWSSEGLATLIGAVRGLGYAVRSVGAIVAELTAPARP